MDTNVVFSPARGPGILEDFGRPDENLENNANWTLVEGSAGDVQVVSNQCVSSALGHKRYTWNGISPADLYIEWVFVTASTVSGDNGVEFIVRASGTRGTDEDGYSVLHDPANPSQNQFRVVRKDNDAETVIIESLTDPSAGDILRAELVGSSIEIFINGTSVGTATDSNHTSGAIRLGGYQDNASDSHTIDNLRIGPLD